MRLHAVTSSREQRLPPHILTADRLGGVAGSYDHNLIVHESVYACSRVKGIIEYRSLIYDCDCDNFDYDGGRVRKDTFFLWSLVPSGLTPLNTINCRGRVYRPYLSSQTRLGSHWEDRFRPTSTDRRAQRGKENFGVGPRVRSEFRHFGGAFAAVFPISGPLVEIQLVGRLVSSRAYSRRFALINVARGTSF